MQTEIDIVLDRPRRMRINFNALCQVEEVTGVSTLDGTFWTAPRASHLRALVWACLHECDPTVTLDDVGRWLTPATMHHVFTAIAQLWQAAMPEELSASSVPSGDGARADVMVPFASSGETGSASGL